MIPLLKRKGAHMEDLAALRFPSWRLNEGGAVWLIKDWVRRPLVRRRPLP